jgi:8-oxo-dGTP diphosphatase
MGSDPHNRGMERRVVVGAAIVRDGRILAARRTAPSSAAGRWEFPGGKVEPGETDAESLRREIVEELGVGITVARWLDGEQPIGERYLLRVAVASLDAGEPTPTEHDLLRWLSADELRDVDWLDSDRPFLSELSTLLPRLGG